VCAVLGVARSNVVEKIGRSSEWRDRRLAPAGRSGELLEEVRAVLGDRPTYGYRRIQAMVNRTRRARGLSRRNHKAVYRVMKEHDLLLQRYTGGARPQIHDGTIAVDKSDARWCSDGFEIACDNGERVQVAFALDCCDREAMSWVATTKGIDGMMVRDLMVDCIEQRFGVGQVLPKPIEWLTDNGSPYIARDTRAFAQELGFDVCRTPIQSPQSNGMAEAFVKTFKRDYVDVNPQPNAMTTMTTLARWFDDYNEHHPHSALKMRSPREYRASVLRSTRCPES